MTTLITELKDKISRKLADHRNGLRKISYKIRKISDFKYLFSRKLADYRYKLRKPSYKILKISDIKKKIFRKLAEYRGGTHKVSDEITRIRYRVNAQIEPHPEKPPEGLKVYQKGNSQFIKTETSFGVCLMGGGRRTEEALRWLLNKSGGGDIVVLCTTDYRDELTNPESITNILWNLGTCHSITTLVIDSREKANSSYIEQILKNAEALWIPGGDQTEYYDLWNGTKIQTAVNSLANEKKIPIGGTSAGMHIMGKLVHTPYGGNSVISEDALDNPYLVPEQVDRSAGITFQDNFFDIPYMDNIITDTHWSERNRMGRSLVFLARVIVDGLRNLEHVRLIACDEGTAVCIAEDGIAKIFGSYPEYHDYAFFIKPNCFPNECTDNHPLTWETDTGALTVYKIKGDPDGRNTFDLKSWTSRDGEKFQLNIHRGMVEDTSQRRLDIQEPR